MGVTFLSPPGRGRPGGPPVRSRSEHYGCLCGGGTHPPQERRRIKRGRFLNWLGPGCCFWEGPGPWAQFTQKTTFSGGQKKRVADGGRLNPIVPGALERGQAQRGRGQRGGGKLKARPVDKTSRKNWFGIRWPFPVCGGLGKRCWGSTGTGHFPTDSGRPRAYRRHLWEWFGPNPPPFER